MLTATLGGLMKDHRIKKRLSQLEVSLRIGWKDTTRLSKIEQGRVGKPTRKTLDKIMSALELNEKEQAEMLMAGNIIPNLEEAAAVLKKLKNFLNDFNTPIILLDFAWNIYFLNNFAKELYSLSKQEYELISKQANWFESHFTSEIFSKVRILGGNSKQDLKPFKEHIISHFKYEQSENLNEKWLKNIISNSSKDPDFRKLWTETNVSDKNYLDNFEVYQFQSTSNNKKQEMTFNIYSIKPAFDFRFTFLIYEPTDKKIAK